MNQPLDTTKGWEAPFLRGMIAIDDGDEIREVLSAAQFAPMGADGRPFYYDNVIATLDGPEHIHRRRIANRVFLEGPLKDYMDSVYTPVLDLCLAELQGQRGPDGLIHADLMPLGWRVLVRFSLRILGLDGDEDQTRLDEVVTIIQVLSEALVSEWSTNAEALVRAARKAEAEFKEHVFLPSVARRRAAVARVRAGTMPRSALRMDLITTLLLEETLDWTDDALFGEITMILSAASGSSVQGLPHFLTHLEEWFAAHPEDRQRALDDPDFLRNASHEALRLFVSTPARIRVCTADVTLSTGRQIRAGEKVAVLFLPPNTTSEEFGAEPGTFDPYRKPADSPWGLSFGYGRHACMGRRLVTSSTQHGRDGTMAAVLRRLYESGVRMDTDRPVRIDETSFKRLWISMPIVFERL